MKKAIVVGSGAGGATVAKELQGIYNVTLLDAGKEFRPFSIPLSLVDRIKKTGLLIDEREIQLLFSTMQIRKTEDRMVMVNGIGLGGTTTLATGNAIRMDQDLKGLGINLDAEFDELYQEIPVSTEHQKRWRPATQRLFEICQEINLHPTALPKMGDLKKCVNCGHCVLGCKYGAKWDSRKFLKLAIDKGATLKTGCHVEQVIMNGSKAVGVKYRKSLRSHILEADLVVLAAGGFGTPAILENSGIRCDKRLFVDPVLCVAARWEKAFQNKEISMPFVVERPGFILSPYFDYLSYFFNKKWRYPAQDTLGIMIKFADTNTGYITNKKIRKTLNEADHNRLKEGIDICHDIFGRLGIKKEQTILGTINAGHPGGMLPLTEHDALTLHPQRLPENLYISDATLFPTSLGNPPSFTIMALAKRIGKLCLQN
ncbi:GMC family oxidoreductase [candidate division KSB1 bacterium]|nr:GMC family oxidoreductase [candidate division KSB1 bacterium]